MGRVFSSIITIIFCTVTLVACGGGAAGGSTGNANISANEIKTSARPLPTLNPPIDIPTYDMLDGNEDVTLPGLAFLKSNTITYTRTDTDTSEWQSQNDVTVVAIMSPFVKLTFDIEGNISGVETYVDNTYTATDNTHASDKKNNFTGNADVMFNDTIEDSDIADKNSVVNAYRGENFFGFDANYMVYVNWRLDEVLNDSAIDDEIYDFDGVMIAGIETSDLNNIAGVAGFSGKGRGIYGDTNDSYDTLFDVTATIDFTTRNLAITTRNTACTSAYSQSCAANNIDMSDLNFTASNLGFASDDGTESVNNISETVTLDSTLAGKLDARFYGDKAQEFGGAFSLTNATNYYIGAFGALSDDVRNYILNPEIPDLPIGPPKNMALDYSDDPYNPVSVPIPDFLIPTKADDTTRYTAITELLNDRTLNAGDIKTFTLPAIGTHRYYQYDYQRADKSVDWEDSTIVNTATVVRNISPVVTLDFHVQNSGTKNEVYFQGGDGKAGVTIYHDTYDVEGNVITDKYEGSSLAAYHTGFQGSMLGINDKHKYSYIHLHRGHVSETADYFGFKPDYLVGIAWYIDEEKNQLGADDLAVTTYQRFGRMIAGLETGATFGDSAFGAIPNSGNIMFTGKGFGSYGYELEESSGTDFSQREALHFDVAARVNFDEHNIEFSTYNSCYGRYCILKRDILDFSATINFADNNISQQITADNGELEGTLDARFYGDTAQEFGGIFTMRSTTDNNRYYYGQFATRQSFDGTKDSVIVNDDVAVEAYYSIQKSVSISNASLTQAANMLTESSFVLLGTAVQVSDNTHYVRDGGTIGWNDADNVQTQNEVSVAYTLIPTVMLDFDNKGVISTIEADFGFNTYQALLDNDASGTAASGTIIKDAYHDENSSHIKADRNAFGFASDYMIYISWDLAKENLDTGDSVIYDDMYHVHGDMVAGIETQDIPVAGTIRFAGEGQGKYGDVNNNISYATRFATNANVDFKERIVAFSTSKTTCHDDCTAIDETMLAKLNLSTTLMYDEAQNNISNAISGARIINDEGMFGVVNARFYGEAFEEFGGTFYLANSARYSGRTDNKYYYGAFGAVRESNIIKSYMIKALDEITIATAQEVSIATDSGDDAYISLTAASGDTSNTANKTFTLSALGVQGKVSNNHTRLSKSDKWVLTNIDQTVDVTNMVGSAASLTFDGAGNIATITVHLDGKTYVADQIDDTVSATMLSATISGADNNASNTLMTLDRSSKFFGFASEYMAHISWHITKDVTALDNASDDLTAAAYNSHGIMIAGMETADDNIPIQGAVEFISKGRGIYGNRAQIYQTKFDVIAAVSFNDNHVTINSRNSCKADDCDNTKLPALNFSTEKIFYTGNDIDSAIHTGDLSGVIDARFYGGAAQELGGTFTMRSDADYHYGGFGGYAKDFYDFNDTQDTSLTLATAIAPHHVLNGIASITQSDRPLPQIFTIEQANQKISQIKIDTLDFAGNITHSQDFNKDFSLQDNKALYLNDGANLTLDDNVAGSLRIIHKTKMVNGIPESDKSNWIAVVHDYQNALPRGLNYQTFGIMYNDLGRGGFSTGLFTNNIPTQGTQNFAGRAYGYYQNGGDKYLTRAKILIDADFDVETATITTSETRRVKISGNVLNDRNGGSFEGFNGSAADDDSLNFTGSLSYNASYKWFRGNVTAALGDGEAVMKAYGANAEEVGGTFRLENADATQIYAGAFGAGIPLDVPDTNEALTLATLETPYVLQGVGKINDSGSSSSSVKNQTFEIHQSEGKITQVKLNNVNSNGDITSSVNYDQKLNATTQIYINDGANLVANDDSIAGSLRFIHTNNKSKWVAVVHDYANETWGWQYQTIGLTKEGSFSAGLLTNDLPTGGGASFTGRAYGYYKRYSTFESPANEKKYLTRAKVTVDIDFADGSAFIATSETRITAISNSSFSYRAGRSFTGNKSKAEGDEDFYADGDTYVALNFSGTLTYKADEKQFRGSLNTNRYNSQTKGGAVMKAYGPNAEEVGGTFRIEDVNQGWKSPRREFTYTGAFGAKQDE